jgi:GTP cyclohydrolase II
MDPQARGPVVSSVHDGGKRNAIGANGGAYGVYRALSIAAGALNPNIRPNFKNTEPAFPIGPFDTWGDSKKIVTMDPWGAVAAQIFSGNKGLEVLPTIAITRAHIDVPEVQDAIRKGRLKPDGKILLADGSINVTKAAIEPVWYLPGVAERMGVSEAELRELLFTETNGSYPELISRTDLKVFLPPTGGQTAYIFGDPSTISDVNVPLTCRVHDECNGSDVFGSDICTCRPYLMHAIEESVRTAQNGGAGLVVYFRKEGRALGEVTKYLVYNARKRTGDRASEYFNCTAQVAGVEDSRFQAMMPDVLHWLGIKRIDRFVSMSNMKYDAIVKSGIEIIERVPIPKDLVPADAQVEIDAKVAAGYEGGTVYADVDLTKTRGRAGKDFGI